MSKLRNLTGQRFNMFTVLHRAESNRSGITKWLCVCDCGSEKVVSMDHLTRKKNPQLSCGCFKAAMKGPNHPQWNGCGDISGNWWDNHVLRERKQNKRPRVPCTVSIEYAWSLFQDQGGRCALSGRPLRIDNTHRYNTASVDRIDSSLGYEEGNIQWVHKHINSIKRGYAQEYFIKLCKEVALHNLGEVEF